MSPENFLKVAKSEKMLQKKSKKFSPSPLLKQKTLPIIKCTTKCE